MIDQVLSFRLSLWQQPPVCHSCAEDFVSIIHLSLDNIYAAITHYIKSESNEDSRNSVRIWFLLATKEALFATVKCIRCFQRWLAASNKHQLLLNIFIISDWAVSTRTRDSRIICVSVKLPICLKGVRHLISTSKSNSCSCGRGDVTSRQASFLLFASDTGYVSDRSLLFDR